MSRRSHPSFNYSKAAYLIITALTFFRIFYATTLELVGDEAYYWLWSIPQHLDMCYFSKGPAVAWTIAAGTYIFGNTVLGIRFFAVMLAAGTSLWIFFLARQMFGARTAFWAVVLGNVVPLFAVGSILMTIDPLSVFFWTMAAVVFWRAKDSQKIMPWVGTGFLIGCGALAKYTNLAQLLCFALFLIVTPPFRFQLRRAPFWLMVLFSFFMMGPVILWNAKYNWITVEHIINRGGLDRSFNIQLSELVQFFTEQALVYSPLVFLGILIAVFMAFSINPMPITYRYLLALFLPLFLFYTGISLNENALGNWTAPAFVTGIILAAAVWLPLTKLRPSWKYFAITALVVAFLQTLVLHNTLPLNLPRKMDPLDRVRGSESLAREVSLAQEQFGATFIIADQYSWASLLSFYLPNQPQVFLPSMVGIQNQFSFWSDYSDGYWGHDALFVTESNYVPEQLKREFTSIALVREFQTEHRGRKLRQFYIFLCRDFGGLIGDPEPIEDRLISPVEPEPAPARSRR
jgi:4-amino-4-deoxy-L-arabinose transferase-like glycosyltransferase